MNHPIIKRIIFLVCCLAVLYAQAQQAYFKIDTVKYGEPDKKRPDIRPLNFPILTNLQDTAACHKINHQLQLSQLELIKGQEKKNIFEKVTGDDKDFNNHWHYTSMEFKVGANNNRIFSVSFSEVSSPITEWTNQYYNFNSTNGDLIRLADMFTKDNYAKFKRRVIKQREKDLDALFKRDTDIVLNMDTAIIKKAFIDDNLEATIIGDSSITVFINQKYYNVNKYDFERANGEVISTIKLDLFKDLLNEQGKWVFRLKNEIPQEPH